MSEGKIQIRLGAWLLLGIAVFFFTASFTLKNFTDEKPLSQVITAPALAETSAAPAYFYFNKNAEPLKLSAQAYVVGDLDTGEIILSKNEKSVWPMASVSKLMTALVTSLTMKPDENAEVTKSAVATYGGNGGLRAKEKLKVGDLLYPLLLESSNDAAEVLAEHGGRDNFINEMNTEANKLGMSSTTYQDPSGLSSQNKSTALDLFTLARFLHTEKPDIMNITTQRSYADDHHGWSSNNQFLRDVGYIGGKSGYTDPAKQTVVSMFYLPLGEVGNRSIAITLLQSQDRKKDVETAIKYLKKNIYYGTDSDANIAWVKQKDGIPEIKDPDFVTFSFLGDIMVDRGVESSVAQNFGGDFSALFDNMSIIKDSDVVFANLEGTASDVGHDLHNLYSFHMNPSIIPALKGAGVSIVSVANNHVGDWGVEAYQDTLSRLRENEILYTGGGENIEEAKAPTVIEKYGMKIGFLGFSDVGPEYMRADGNSAGILSASNPHYKEIISEAAKNVDFLIVSIHFGEEYKKEHNARQEELAHDAIDSGAKIVVGHHPHVVEDTEVYKNGFIAYSLGNFIFDQAFSEDTMGGMLLGMKIWRNGTLDVTKSEVKLNSAFQPAKIIPGKEQKLDFTPTLITP
jgi:D-alanyl-D-alanine carboxypeptidase